MNKKIKIKNKGFTLVELLVVIAVIGILATLAVIALQQARSRTRDSKRVADIKQIQTTLELFFNEQGRYPTIDEWNSGSIIVSSTNQVLMQNVPSAPYPADGSCSADQNNFYYIPSDDYSTYNLSFCLGSGVSDLSEGPKCLTPGGIINFDCSGDGNEENENNENTANVCPQECDFGYICQSGSCVVDTFQCGQNVSYNGYSYPTVEIGTQCWFKENLRTDKFRNGNVIANVTTQWNVTGGVGPAWCYYNNDSNNENTYGKLYSVYAALDPRGICPPGFRLPTRAEFDSLISFAGSNRYGLLSCRQVDSPLGGSCATGQHPRWNSSASYNGNDSLGFSALPGGSKEGSSFVNLGVSGHFWTFTPYQTTRMYEGVADISNSNGFYSSLLAYFTTGRSIRCIKNNNQGGKTLPSVSITTPTNITANKATSGGNITNTGGSIVYAMGVVWSESDTPIVGASNSQFLNTIGVSNTSFTSNIVGLWPNKTYYIRAYAVNEVGLAYSNTISFTTPDPCGGVSSVSYNGYSYPTVGIGTQCWFKENLRTDKFKNGDSIPNVTASWSTTTGPAWCAYNNDMGNEANYGKIYSVYAALDPRGVCPSGWRMPTQADFDNLILAATPYNGFSLHSCRMVNSPLGGSCATDQHPRWNYSSAYTGTDIFGFSALPGGYKYGATFYNLGVSGHFWTITPYQTTRMYDARVVYDNANGFFTSILDTYFSSGRSVRCIKDGNFGSKTLPSVSITTPTNITANKATSGGNITNTGGSIVYAMGVVWSESDTPIVGASNSQFLNTIGVSNTSFTSNIVGLWPNKTYYIRAYAVNEVGLAYSNTISFTTPDPCGGVSSVSYNGYSYPTVGIGTQCWFKENLRTDKFKNGDSIPNVTTQWNVSGGVGPAWCAYNNDMNNEANYGKLYSSYAVLDSRGLCPDGWRVPSQTDFDNLVSAATPYNGFSLHSCRMVNSPLGGSCATDQHPRWNYSSAYTGTDIFGFSALPGGYKYGATFYNLGVSGHFWTTTPYQTTRLYDGRAIYDNANGFLTSIGDTYFTSARSVRCIKN